LQVADSASGNTQIIKQIWKNEGIRGFYRGLGNSYLGLAHMLCYLPLYDQTKIYLKKEKKFEANQAVLAASAISKIIASFITYPNFAIFAKSVASQQKSVKLTTIAIETIKQKGFFGLYKGFTLDMFRVLPSNMLTFYLYESLRN
jgi:solute carrier family 25 folate transporter 32